MTFEEYRRHDATALAELIRTKQVSAAEVLEAALQRAEAVNPRINAIIHPLYDLAKKQLARLPEQAPFAGVPFLLKDLAIEYAGTPFSEGCAGLRDNVSRQTSVIVHRLEQAGLLFIGKTNTPEFGLTPYTEPQAFGPTCNPWQPDRTPGGSSGGSAAAVAAGITPFATASDGGGSIRIPASCCGLFGLKPSRGRITLGPQIGDAWQGASMEHCVSRSVRDSAALLDAIHGASPGDPYQIAPPTGSYLNDSRQLPGQLRIGFTTTHTLGQEVHADCQAAVTHTARLLEKLGHQVAPVEHPFQRSDLTEAFLYMIFGETAATVKGLEERLGRPATRHDVEPNTWSIALIGRTISAERFVSARRRWNDVARRMAAFHQEYDLLLTPTTALPPFPIGHLQPTPAERRLVGLVNRLGLGQLALGKIDELAEKVFTYIPFTPLANMTGQPSMSVPLHWNAEGLPVGSMFTASFGREDLLFRLAGQLEIAQPWFERWPELT